MFRWCTRSQFHFSNLAIDSEVKNDYLINKNCFRSILIKRFKDSIHVRTLLANFFLYHCYECCVLSLYHHSVIIISLLHHRYHILGIWIRSTLVIVTKVIITCMWKPEQPCQQLALPTKLNRSFFFHVQHTR